MHPAHVPLHGESKAVILRLSGHLRPCRRLLRNHHNAPDCVQASRLFRCLKNSIASRFLFPPYLFGTHCPVFSSVVQVQHRSDSVHTEPIDVKLFDPVKCICDQEILYFILCHNQIPWFPSPDALPSSDLRTQTDRCHQNLPARVHPSENEPVPSPE